MKIEKQALKHKSIVLGIWLLSFMDMAFTNRMVGFCNVNLVQIEPRQVDEIEALLMAQDEQIERFRKVELGAMQVHPTQTSIQRSTLAGGNQQNH